MLSIQEAGANSSCENIWDNMRSKWSRHCFLLSWCAYLGSGFAWASPQRCHAASQKLSEWVSQKSSRNTSRCCCNFTPSSMTWSTRKQACSIQDSQCAFLFWGVSKWILIDLVNVFLQRLSLTEPHCTGACCWLPSSQFLSQRALAKSVLMYFIDS